QAASIVISQRWRIAGAAECSQHVQHALEGSLEFLRQLDIVYGRKHRGMQKEIQRISVIVDRLLEMQTVGMNLPFGFVDDDFPAALLPSARQSKFRTHSPDKKQAHAFAK